MTTGADASRALVDRTVRRNESAQTFNTLAPNHENNNPARVAMSAANPGPIERRIRYTFTRDPLEIIAHLRSVGNVDNWSRPQNEDITALAVTPQGVQVVVFEFGEVDIIGPEDLITDLRLKLEPSTRPTQTLTEIT